MRIIHYPHPTLRHKSRPIKRVDKALKHAVSEMFDLMFEQGGVGLAANQVDLPVRLFVMNEASDPGEAESLVFINPVLTRPHGSEEMEEGCLSLPKLYAPVKRPARIWVSAYNLQGQPIEQEVSGYFGRIIQHETDHLDGVLFIDRLTEGARMSAAEAIAKFERVYEENQERGEFPSEKAIQQRLAELDQQYCG